MPTTTDNKTESKDSPTHCHWWNPSTETPARMPWRFHRTCRCGEMLARPRSEWKQYDVEHEAD